MTTTSLSFAGTLRSELHGTWSVPGAFLRWLVLLAAPAAALTTIAAAHFSPGVSVASGSMVGGAVLALVGGLSIAGEYATGAVRTTVTAAPRRTARFSFAKSLAVVLIGLAVGWVGGLGGAAANGILGSAALSVLADRPRGLQMRGDDFDVVPIKRNELERIHDRDLLLNWCKEGRQAAYPGSSRTKHGICCAVQR